jgi:protease secretion system membrane fusion protein
MKLLKKKLETVDLTANDVTVIKDESPKVEIDDKKYARFGWLVVLLGVGGFLAWATVAPLDKGVPVNGFVMAATNRKAVQHQTGGIIDEILVKEGDFVKAGQPLVKMNDVQAKANAEMTRVQYFTSRAIEARLIAERDGKPNISFPQELEAAKNDPRVANNIALQSQLFTSRQASLHSELAAVDENIAGLKAQVNGLQESLVSQKQQLQYLKEQLDGMRDLAKEGYVARNRLLDLERTYAQVNGGMSENIGNIGRAQRQIAEFTLRRTQRLQDYQKEVRSQLTDVQKDAEALQNRLQSQDFDLKNVIVRAPVDGNVVALNVFTKGGVVSPGFRMMDIVPADDPLVIEGQVQTQLIDKVHKDLPVELNFVAFNKNTTPHVQGVVTEVSADRFVDEKTGAPYYKLQAQVTPEGKKALANLQVRPGMPVEVFVKTGERTLMSYLLKPVFDRAKTALTEE